MSIQELSSPPIGPKLHDPLPKGDFIRLLNLCGGEGDQPITCEMSIYDIAVAPPYEAISYVWGDPAARSQVICNGQLIDVTNNLAGALRRVRLADRARIVWADAICIDQSDSAERGHQVNLMGIIYARAKGVLIWLGEDVHNEAPAAFELIREVFVYFGTKMTEYGEFGQIPQPAKTLPFMELSRWKSITSLLLQDWFRRAWVLQEVGLAKNAEAFWGSASIEFSQIIEMLVINEQLCMTSVDYHLTESGRLLDAYIFIWATFDNEESWRTQCLCVRSVWKHVSTNKKNDDELLSVLVVGSRFEASDNRDRIYAFLGHPTARVAHSSAQRIVDADYTIGLSELYWNIAVKLIDSTNSRPSLLLLSAVQHSSEEQLNSALVSWIPQWHAPGKAAVIGGVPGLIDDYSAGISTNASLQAFAEISSQFRDDKLKSGLLRVHGIKFDEVLIVSDRMGGEDEIMAGVKETGTNVMLSTYPLGAALSTISSAVDLQCKPKTKAIEDISLTLVAAPSLNACDDWMIDAITAFAAHCNRIYNPGFNTMIQDKLGVATPWSTQSEEANDYLVNQYHGVSAFFCYDKRFFITNDGRYGVGPAVMRAGDICCILVGTRVPFILRPATPTPDPGSASDAAEQYRLVGECYIHGVMEGEILEKRFEFEPDGFRDIVLV